MHVTTNNKKDLSHVSAPERNPLINNSFTRRLVLPLAALTLFLPMKAYPEPQLESSRESQVVAGDAKKILGGEYQQLLADIKKSPAQSEEKIRAFIDNAVDTTRGSSLAARLREEDGKVFESMNRAITNLSKNLPGLKADLDRLASTKAGEVAKGNEGALVKNDPVRTIVEKKPIDFTKLPNCQQPEGSYWCGAASAQTLAQLIHGFKLSDKFLELSAHSMSSYAKKGATMANVRRNLLKMGIPVVTCNPGENIHIASRKDAIAFARNALKNEVAPLLKNGHVIGLPCKKFSNSGHGVGLLDYDEAREVFLVADPAAAELTSISIEKLAADWPGPTGKRNNYRCGVLPKT